MRMKHSIPDVSINTMIETNTSFGFYNGMTLKYFCIYVGTDSGIKRKGESYNEEKRKEEKRTRDTVIIAGSLVSTVSFILVICWVTYCCWKRQHPSDSSSSNRAHTAGSATSSSTPKSEGIELYIEYLYGRFYLI